jgi:hypothetical protein
MQKIEKICSNITMVEVQVWTPLENNTMWQHFGPSVMCSHPQHSYDYAAGDFKWYHPSKPSPKWLWETHFENMAKF